MRRLAGLLLAPLLCACARPVTVRDDRVMLQMAASYRAFYPAAGDPDRLHDAGLLRPRFGLPAIAQAGADFALTVMERGGPAALHAALLRHDVDGAQAAACVAGAPVEGCHALLAVATERTALGPALAIARHTVRPGGAPPPGAYDLYLVPAIDAPTRTPDCVWLRADAPGSLAEVRVAQLSDLHVGKGEPGVVEAHLHQVIADLNALRPDLVVVTGDLVHWGTDASLAPRARELLRAVAAPVLVVAGNHDLGVIPGKARQLEAWANFARWFHPFRHFSVTLGGWDFVGFDSGPSEFTPRVMTRGIDATDVAALGVEVEASRAAGQRGVVLFSHAPTRAVLDGRAAATATGLFGRMAAGGAALEAVMLRAAALGQRVIHLAGHTHWSDVFEARRAAGGLEFARWSAGAMSPCERPIVGRAALVTTQSASHGGVFFKESARGYGFAFLVLGDGPPRLSFHRHGIEPQARYCGAP